MSFLLPTFVVPNQINCFMDTKKYMKVYAETPTFRLTNPNPRWATKRGFRWDTGDCTVRAIANSINCSWLEAYDFLSSRAREEFVIMNDGVKFREWLVAGGAKWTHCPAVAGKKRMTAEEFAKKHPEGRYILSLANHEAACVDGKILDAWNCGSKCVVGFLDMSDFKLSK